MIGQVDHDRAFAFLKGLVRSPNEVSSLVFDGEPKAKARHRINPRGGIWTPSSPDEDALAWTMRSIRPTKLTGPVAVVCVFYRGSRRRMDTDNMVKLVLDAGTRAGLWDDDRQVTGLVGVMEWDKEHPRTVVAWAPHSTTFPLETPTFVCESCERPVPVRDGHRLRFCSRECRAASIRQAKTRPGQGRGPKGQPAPACRDCGAPVSKRSYLRCRSCWTTARAAGIS